jgi:YegS/Rv2252/BmrU family lipid kinase
MLGADRLNPAQTSLASPRTVTCIINGSAGSHDAGAAKKRVIELFQRRGTEVSVLLAEEGSQIPELVRRAIEERSTVIVAAGGDGTVNAVASGTADSSAALGVLPLGTLNHFAKDVGVPIDLEAAVDNVLTGRIIRVDVGKVNGKIFLNNSSLGLYPAIVRQREGFQKRGHGKWWAFAVAIFQVLRRYQRLYVRLQVDNQPEVDDETPFVFIGNNQYQLCGFRIGERECVNAGKLWIYRAPRANRAALFRLALHSLRGKHDTGELEVFSTEKCRIRTQKTHVHVATDGEIQMMRGPLNYVILPKALSIIVPATARACESG